MENDRRNVAHRQRRETERHARNYASRSLNSNALVNYVNGVRARVEPRTNRAICSRDTIKKR